MLITALLLLSQSNLPDGQLMRRIDRTGGDMLALIRVSNELRSLPKQSVLKILREYKRLNPYGSGDIYSLTQAIFAPTASSKNTLIVDGVPLDISLEPDFSLSPAPWDKDSSNWQVNPQKLRPTDDPFTLYKKALPYLKGDWADRRKNFLRYDISNLVRNVQRPYDPKKMFLSEAAFERQHQAFLKLKPRWDEARQMYVRGDGSFDADPVKLLEPQHTFRFKPAKGVDMEISLTQDAGMLESRWEMDGKYPPGLALAWENADTGKEIHRNKVSYNTWDRFHSGAKRVRIKMLVKGKTYRSQAFTMK